MKKLVTLLILIALVLFSVSCSLPFITTKTNTPTTTTISSTSTTLAPTTTSTGLLPELNVHFIDVGQGDSILIDLGQTEVLIDGGEASPGVVSYLNNFVDGPLEVMVATHPHADHIGGLTAVLNAYQVQQIWHNGDTSTSQTYAKFMAAVQSENAEVHVGKRGDRITTGSLTFTLLNPVTLTGTTNNNSIVLDMEYRKVGFLFTGDAEKEAEGAMLVAPDMPVPDVEILKVGHHGSRTASSMDFLNATSPEVAVYMAEMGNTYGHPHQETLDSLARIGAKVYGTDVNGTIIISTDGDKYTIQSERQGTPKAPALTTTTPTTTTEATDSIGQVPQSTELIPMSYKWSYGNKEWTWELQIPQASYDYYKELPRSPTENYSVYVTHPLDDTYIEQLANKLDQAAQQEGYSEFQKISFAVAFVQSLPYTSDSITTSYDEYPRYPIETLVDNGGDCEDTAILMASLVDAMGYGTVLLVFPETADIEGHCAVGVKGGEGIYGTYWEYEGNRYYFLETTGTGWEIGQIPEEYKTASANIYPMIPAPILTHNWSYEGTTQLLELKVIVDNLGSAEAQGIYVKAGFDAGNDMWWNSKESPTANIEVGGSVTYTLNLSPPSGEYTRLIIKIIYNGYTVEESYSEWFDT